MAETRTFRSEPQESLPEDVLYWAALFRATPEDTAEASGQVERRPEPAAPH